MQRAAQLEPITVDAATGLAAPAQQYASPNCDTRPSGTPIDLIIIHNISLPPGQFGGRSIHDLFCNQLDTSAHPYFEQLEGLKVSAHLLIDRQGFVTQFVPFHLRAWHAGQSEFNGRSACNDFSIGIELEGEDEVAYADAQYAQLAAVISALRSAYPTLASGDICGHSDVAPSRKTDPGPAFDWARLQQALTAPEEEPITK
ncbi:MAG: 1,6-anhydro-N-acetylmuramyl-L-alanine amidase AmpD [Pseudomonadota bacterium]